MRKLTAALLLLMFVAAACYGSDPNTTEEGKSLPIISADFPDAVEAGSLETLTLSVENPGPGEFSSLFVTFSVVGAAKGVSLPQPIVDVAVKGRPPSVVSVDPEPVKTAEGIRFRFDPLPAGETTEITFELRMPEKGGVAANSVQVYDGAEPERVRGVLLATKVE